VANRLFDFIEVVQSGRAKGKGGRDTVERIVIKAVIWSMSGSPWARERIELTW
jgi:hypothetical protein